MKEIMGIVKFKSGGCLACNIYRELINFDEELERTFNNFELTKTMNRYYKALNKIKE